MYVFTHLHHSPSAEVSHALLFKILLVCWTFLMRCIYFVMAQKRLVGQRFLIVEVSRLHSDAPLNSVGLIWTSDQPVAETSTWQHTTLTTDRHALAVAMPASERPQNHAWDRAVTGFGPKETYLLTYCTVRSPSWAANRFAASQEIPRILRNPKVHYRTHKRPPAVSILGQPNPVHIPTSHLLQIHPNIIHPSTPRSPQWSLSLRFPHQNHIHPPLLTHTSHMPSPSHSSPFYHPHNIGWAVQII
jgi:hypothetical protein